PISPPAQGQRDEHRASREAIGKIAPFILRALRRRGVPSRDRPELAQEILLAALEAWPRYDADLATPEKWLRGIIHNQVQRWRARRARDPLSENADEELCDEAGNSEELLMSEERRKLVHQLYQEIPVAYRDAMIAHEVEGMTLAEIAEVHGIPV